jgi:hypothetical protein
MIKVSLYLTMLLCIVVLSSTDLFAQCAMCGASVQSSDRGAEMAAGLNSGILYLLAIPYLIFMTFAVVIYRKIKQTKDNKTQFIRN